MRTFVYYLMKYLYSFLVGLCIFIGAPIGLSAQQVVRGVIFDNRTSQRVSNAIILNTKNNALVKSNELGVFQIKADILDTLSITKSGYTEYYQKVSSYQDVFIRLQQIIRLNEVTVTGQSKKQELDEIKREYRKKSFYGGKPPVLAYVFHPVTALYEKFGKEPGQARRFNNFYKTELEETEISRRFNPTIIKELTPLKETDMRNFIEIYKPQYETLSSWDDYELIKYIKASAATYIKSGKPQSGFKTFPKLPSAPDLGDKEIKLKKIKY
ncbi:MAG: hypothetical protein JWN56_2721 [Sphingobacteriales bacterium]|nr:hypothetical protein [Sphingobacteriales bacterium]